MMLQFLEIRSNPSWGERPCTGARSSKRAIRFTRFPPAARAAKREAKGLADGRRRFFERYYAKAFEPLPQRPASRSRTRLGCVRPARTTEPGVPPAAVGRSSPPTPRYLSGPPGGG